MKKQDHIRPMDLTQKKETLPIGKGNRLLINFIYLILFKNKRIKRKT